MPSVADRQRALDARFPRWEGWTLHGLLDRLAAEHPERPYVITDQRAWSYAEMANWSRRLAAGLTTAGLRAGENIAVVMANFPAFVALKYAISRTGATCVPVNFLNRRDELAYVLRQSDAVMLVTMDAFRDLDYLGMLDDIAPGWERDGGGTALPMLRRVLVYGAGAGALRTGAAPFDSLEIAGADAVSPREVPPSVVSDIVYTSGTTGGPKGVMLTHDMLLRAAFGSARCRAFEDGRRIAFSLPMYHVYGYVEGMLASLFVAGSIVPQLQFQAAATLDAICRHSCTDVLLIPTMTLSILEELRIRPRALPTLKAMISSGGKAPEGLWAGIRGAFGDIELTTGYGMTEATASTTVTRPDDPDDRLRSTNGRLRDVGVAGDPALGGLLVGYRVVDPQTGMPLAPGELGELRMRGPGVTPGYYRKPEATDAARDPEGWFRTGDLGRIDAEGYLVLAGRLKECYRCGGEQVIPGEVEDVLSTHPAVALAQVVALPEARMGEVGVACIVPRDNVAVSPEELIAHCAARLARFKVPRHVIFITAEELPTTPTGRPRKFLLAELAARRLGCA